MKKPPFINEQIYHVYNRGVEKRDVFLNKQDYLRFIHDLFELNDEENVLNGLYYFNNYFTKIASQSRTRKPRKLLVEILIFTLMPNHFHLLLKQKKEGGVVKFMQKLGTAYTMYFNKKYERVGSLFQGRFKAVHVSEEAHFIHLPYYIHSNPLALIYGGSTSIDWEKALAFLERYRWSSFPDYVGKKNFPSVTSREFLLQFFCGEDRYRKDTEKWLKGMEGHITKIKEVTLE